MAEFRLERFKYNWRGNWQTGTSYKRDDVVRVNGKSYVCLVTHTAALTFRADLTAILPGSNPPQPQPKWTVMTNGREFLGNYQAGINYNLGDIVLNDGTLWICTFSHTSTGAPSEASYWETFANHISLEGDWQTNTVYGPGAVVIYNGIAYKCINPHLSSATLEVNPNDWTVFNEGTEPKSNWSPNTEYRKNDLVKYGGSIFRCIETHTSNSTNIDDSKFEIEFPGTQFDGDWNSSTYYNVGDLVRHRGFVYYSLSNNINSKPFIDSDQGTDDWLLLSRSYKFLGNWSVTGVYKTGDLVLRGGNLYLALRDIGGTDLVLNDQDGSTLDYLDDGTWELFVPGKKWRNFWRVEQRYSVNDVVYYKGSSYTCNIEHISSQENFPGDNGNGYEYWDLLIQAGQPGSLQDKGDIITYGVSRELSGTADTSTLGDTRVQIGSSEQLLSVNEDLEVYWRDITVDADVVYVAKNGIDDTERGTFEKPFRTIRYAAEYVEDTFEPGTPVLIRVGAGRFEEICPISVPAGCAVNGDELRSTTVVASPPIAAYQNDFNYVKFYLEYFETIILNVVTGNAITPSSGNNLVQITTQNYVPTENNPTFPASSIAGTDRIVNLSKDFVDYIEFRISNGNVNPTVVGTPALELSIPISNAALALELNKKFLQAEILARLRSQYPSIEFDAIKVNNDTSALLRGFIRDLRETGNFYTIRAARRYANAVTGSQSDDLFLMRDSTGLRDLTTSGLQGVLQPPRVFELYQRPTGGACVSLDPGWGPNDERMWIVNRSPYIQGVTNIGTGCIGKKIDGSLHNGGTKSMVSNDFTQVLSDGIGVWVSNNARTELVSVFTYYCQIGYFAEDGGVIRATNGNNSYGTYGAIADGADETETPQEVTVFNRNNEAIVNQAFAGGTNDQILLFEYENCGEEYTTADATIIGAGANADVEYTDFRDGGVFEVRLTKSVGDSGDKGGSGYLTRQGSAQETLGASTSIKLSANDVTLDISEILGMRILLTGGTGIGQYGIVNSFNFITKEVGVLKESTGLAGWDHVIPGTPIAADLDLTTRYRIEPRVSATHPGFSSTAHNIFSNRTFVDMKYGGTTQTVTGVIGGSSTPWVDDNGDPVTLDAIVSGVSLQFNGSFAENPQVPFTIVGKTSGRTTTITAITANTGSIIETDISGGGNTFTLTEEFDIDLVAGTGNTFDDDPIPALFDITRTGQTYSVTITNPGAGYSVGDQVVVSGTALGGTTPENDLTITITDVTDDSSNSIQSISLSGVGRADRFVALTNAEYALYSDDGQNWTETSLSFIGDFRALIAGQDKFIALANNSSSISTSLNGVNWTTASLPFSANWRDGIYGGGKFVLVADDSNNVLVSSNGTSWTSRNIPDDTGGADSTISQWAHVTYGKGKYLAVSANDYATATSSDGITWTRHDEVLPDLTPEDPWNIVSVVYGNNRFLIVDSLGRCAYSFDGITWYRGTDAPSGLTCVKAEFGDGVFFVIGLNGTAATNVCATTEDGILWYSRTLSSTQRWSALTQGYVGGTKKWVAISNAATTGAVANASTGAIVKLRADVLQGKFDRIKVWDPGSGYSNSNQPVITVTDPNAETNITYEARLGTGVLPQPDFINRGSGYRSSTSSITITGDGYADIVPEDQTITLAGVQSIPGPGVQIRIANVLETDTEEDLTDLRVFSGVEITDLGDDGSGNGTRLVRFLVSPRFRTEYNITHGTNVTLRERYSQCRITGHDFLDIGTGNFEETNYPDIYAGGRFFTALPENEVFESNGGRVFYTSTDQDGNFRTGELFAVQQSTGIVTVSAEFFQLDGLTELALGGVRLGGSGTVINEFSTDPTFIADSNNIIPTQRAIATFLANRLSVGGENIEVNRLVGGRIGIGGFRNSIENTTGEYLEIPVSVVFEGTFTDADEVVRPTSIQGTIVSQMLFLKQFDEGMQ